MTHYYKLLSPAKLCVLVIVTCVSLTLLDILVVETIYRPAQAWNRIIIWHILYKIIFITVSLAASHFFRNLAPLTTLFFFLFGLEDTLFYALQGYIPTQYPGVHVLWFWEPTLDLVLQVNLIGLATILLFGIVTAKKTNNIVPRLKTRLTQTPQPLTTTTGSTKPAHINRRGTSSLQKNSHTTETSTK